MRTRLKYTLASLLAMGLCLAIAVMAAYKWNLRPVVKKAGIAPVTKHIEPQSVPFADAKSGRAEEGKPFGQDAARAPQEAPEPPRAFPEAPEPLRAPPVGPENEPRALALENPPALAPGPSEFEQEKARATAREALDDAAKPQGALTFKLDYRLAPLVKSFQEHPPNGLPLTAAFDAAAARVFKDRYGPILPRGLPHERIGIHIDAAVTADLVDAVAGTGAIVQNASPRWRTIEAAATASEIAAIARFPGVDAVRLQYGCRTHQQGAAGNQADGAMKANQARTTYGVTGLGQKIGVLSDSANRVIGGTLSNNILTGSSSQTSGDLPAQVEIYDLGPTTGVTDEGAGMMELAYDVAPGAKLAFASAFTSLTKFADNINLLRARGCTITCDDVSYFAEPMFQDGPIAQAVNANAAGGVPHFSSAGNEADAGISGTYTDVNSSTSSTAFPPDGSDFHNWGIGGATPSFLPITLASGASFTAALEWNQPFKSYALGPGSQVDLDLYVYGQTNTSAMPLTQSITAQGTTGTPAGDPVELLSYTNNTGTSKIVYLALDHYQGSMSNVFFRVVFFTSGTVTFNPAVVNKMTVYGHTAAANCISVGAIFFGDIVYNGSFTPDTANINAESFTSKGGIGANGIPYYFDTSGNALPGAPVHRDKPDLAAPDGGNTSFFPTGPGNDLADNPAGIDPDTFPNFFGTSAAAPNAAAVAALMRERNPGLSPAAIRNILQSTAIDVVATNPLSVAGADDRTGVGRIDALAALGAVSSQPQISIGTVQIVSPADPNNAPKYGKVELLVTLSNVSATRFYDPDTTAFGLDLSATFKGPTITQTLNGYFDGVNWRIRYAPRETGSWTFAVKAVDSSGTANWTGGSFTCVASTEPGFARIDGHYLRFSEGQPFFAVGHNTGWQYDVENPSLGGLNGMNARGENLLSFWMNAPWVRPDDGASARQRVPIENAVEGLGNYDQSACAYLDGVVSRAEAAGVYLLPSIWAHPSLRDQNHPWGTGNWDNNAYRVLGAPKDFFDTTSGSIMWKYQQKYYRYLLARWGYSTKIAGWVGLAEIDGTTGYGGTSGNSNISAARTWCGAMRDFFRANDPYRTNTAGLYPLTISKTNSATLFSEVAGSLDAVSGDSYSSQTDDFAVAQTIATDTASFWTSGHPGVHTEFGGQINTSAPTASQPKHLHNGMWAGVASGQCMTPLLWTDGPLSQGQHFPFLTDSVYGDPPTNDGMRRHLEILSQFIGGINYIADPYLAPASTTISQSVGGVTPSTSYRAWGMAKMDRGFAWIQLNAATGSLNLTRFFNVANLDPGSYEVKWFDVWADGVNPTVTNTITVAADRLLSVQVPIPNPARQDIACRFQALPLTNLDFGDAPDSYHTLRASNGARHNPTGPFLGASRDAEADGQPTPNADGDGADEDEDGVSGLAANLVPGQTRNLTVTAGGTGPYRLSAWIDFNRNGSFADAGEQILTNVSLVSGANLLSFITPAGATLGPTYARFRIYSGTPPSFDGYQPEGEVEDYAVTIAYDPPSVAIAAVPTQTTPDRDGFTVGLNATVSYSGPGTLSYQWTKVSGNGKTVFATPTQEDTNVTIYKALAYQFKLSVTVDQDGPGGPLPPSVGSATANVLAEDRFESNDTSAAAVLLEPDGYQNLYLAANSQDWFKINATAGESLVAKIFYRSQDGPDLTLDVLTPSAVSLGVAPATQQDNDTNDTTYIKGIAWTATVSGAYYVKVSGAAAGYANHYSLLLRRGVPSITPAHAANLNIARISPTATGDPNFVTHTTQMAFGRDGRLYCATTDGKVFSFAYDPNGNLSDKKTAADLTVAGKQVYLLGLAFHGSNLYVSKDIKDDKIAEVWRLTDTNADGIYETGVPIVQNVPIGYHFMEHMRVAGNTLYVGIGTKTDEGSSADTGGTGQAAYNESSYNGNICWIQDLTQVPSSANAAGFTSTEIGNGLPYTSSAANKLRVHSSGARNPFGLALDGDGQVWMTNNYTGPAPFDDFDEDFTDDHWDEIFVAAPMGDYGFPNRLWRPPNSTIASGAGFFNPANAVTAFVTNNAAPYAFGTHDPKNPVGLGPNSSPDGFDFYMGNILPLAYHRKAFIARFSAPWEYGMTRDNNTGYQAQRFADVVTLDPQSGAVDRVAKGFNSPLDVKMDPFGNLLVSDYDTWAQPSDYMQGGIYRIGAVSPHPAPYTIFWNVDADGAWQETPKWSPQFLPNQWGSARYDVTINRASANPKVTLDRNITINSLTLADWLILSAGKTLTLTGNLNQQSTSVLKCNVTGDGSQRGRMDVAGAVTLSGGLYLDLSGLNSNLTFPTTINLMTYGTRTGQFDTGVSWTGNANSYSFNIDFSTPHQVNLVITGLGGSPTPVKVERFEAKADGGGVLVEWVCASELENLGFYIWRRKVEDGAGVAGAAGAVDEAGTVNFAALTEAKVKQDGWERVTKQPILGRLTNVSAKTYRYFDSLTEDGRYEYLLESVSTRGERGFYAHAAHVERTAQALDGAQAQGEADVPSKEALEARMERVERAFAEARDEDLSAKRIEARVQALAFGGRADFGFGASGSGAISSGAAGSGTGAVDFQGSASVLPASAKVARTLLDGSSGNSSSAAAGTVQAYAVPASALVPQSEALTALRGVSAVGELAQGWTDPAWVYEAVKAVTQQRGLVTIPRSALPLGYDPRWLAVTRGGHELALLKETASSLSFFAPGYTDDYTDKDAFFLRWKYGARMATKLPAPQGNLFAQNANGSERATATAAFPEVYFDWGYKPLTYTPWFSAKYLYADTGAGTTQGFNIDLPDLVSGDGELAVLLYSYSEQVGAAPDHKLCAYVNGAYVGETTWTGGNQGMTLHFSVPAAALHAGSNLVELQTPVLPGVDVQFSMLHSLELTYTKALSGKTAIAAQSGKLYEVKGLSAEPWVLDVSDPEAPRILGIQTRKELDGTWTARFVAPATAPLEVLPKNANVPVLRLDKRLIQRLTPGIRYLATGPLPFKNALQPLLQARVMDGLYTVFVEQEKLFDAYGYGRYGPEGIRNAVRDTHPSYLLLVGRTNWDYHGYEGVHLDPLCPTFLVSTTRFSQAPSDSAFGDLGDGYPEVAVGRFPVNEVAGLNVCVQRTLAYKGSQSASGQPALLVADRLDPKGIDFAGEADGVEDEVDGFAWTKAYLGLTHETGANVTLQKPEIIDFIRQKASTEAEVVLFVGHGASSVWSNDRILDVPKAAQWTGNCVLLQATCSANYFIHNYPGYYTIVENLLTQPQGGIAASISTTTYLDSPPAAEFMKEVLQASRKPNARWGDALLKAQQYAAKHARGEDSYSDLTRSESLLGDPALKVFGSMPWYKVLFQAPGAVSSRAPDGDF